MQPLVFYSFAEFQFQGGLTLKKVLGLLAICLLLFGCVGSAPADSEQAQQGPRTLWSGWSTARVYGGGTEKAYDITLTMQDDIYYDSDLDAFMILTETATCSYSESSYLPPMAAGMPETVMSRTGSGSYYKEYYETADEDKPRLLGFDLKRADLNLGERENDWVNFVATLTFGETQTTAETGGCMIDQLTDVAFLDDELEYPTVDAEGREAIKGKKTITYGTANIDIEFEYHKVGE